MRVEITLDKEQKISQAKLEAYEAEVHRAVLEVFPATKIRVRRGSANGVEIAGFNLESDRETLSQLLQDVWERDDWS
ncbi:DinI family protein [Erwiniaceae bacterium BAC15a-03b]|uniref:DinI family protein n=1 Tax=Winslowiella arboricola TaxID=2978220 RepID=A0A9J6PUU9_9GAMM|nr:DinI-like family protein [Winslowiella arboricola]MCU5773090.1 DinI family protein [Winslowiella arboricola]MCU5777815.1 DinI family protein [Winslowiella arboricola]